VERIDFGEEREDKGFVIVEIAPGARGARRTAWAFRPVAARPFITVRLSPGGADPLADIRDALASRTDLAGAIVRVKLALAPEVAGQVRLGEVRRLLGELGTAFVGQIETETERQARVRLPLRDDEALDPARMLDRWLELQELSPARRATLLRYAAELLRADEAVAAAKADA